MNTWIIVMGMVAVGAICGYVFYQLGHNDGWLNGNDAGYIDGLNELNVKDGMFPKDEDEKSPYQYASSEYGDCVSTGEPCNRECGRLCKNVLEMEKEKVESGTQKLLEAIAIRPELEVDNTIYCPMTSEPCMSACTLDGSCHIKRSQGVSGFRKGSIVIQNPRTILSEDTQPKDYCPNIQGPCTEPCPGSRCLKNDRETAKKTVSIANGKCPETQGPCNGTECNNCISRYGTQA